MTVRATNFLMGAAVAAPFVLNDFFFVRADGVTAWLTVDYGSRFLALALIFFYSPFRVAALEALHFNKYPSHPWRAYIGRFAFGTGLVVGSALVAEFGIRQPLKEIIPETELFVYPDLDLGAVYWLDITFGLALVALSEELAFRTVAQRVIGAFTDSQIWLVLVSALVFGIIHWSNGVPNIIDSAVVGAVLMVFYLRSGSILGPMAAHYLIDLWYFA
jgi:membrane protease YdiL (CAAX protease family)